MSDQSGEEVLTRAFAERLAAEWVAAWNAHDLERILAHYAEDFEMASPYIRSIAGEPSGVLRGKTAVRRYWQTALQRMPVLRFELLQVLVGAASIVLYYRNQEGRCAAELLRFDAAGRVIAASAHYAEVP